MNDPWTTVAWSSLQVTVVAVAALIMERVASRRGPRAGSWVAAASLSLIAAITPLAFCPMPAGWRSHVANSEARPIVTSEYQVSRGAAVHPASEGTLPGLKDRNSDSVRGAIWWHSLLSDRLGVVWGWGESSMLRKHRAWMRAWGLFLSLGAMVGLCRLAFGFWGVRDCRRRTIPVSDPDLLALLESLRDATGCRRRIEVRERTDRAAATAAAVCWRRPLILLPGGWRDWNEGDLDVVMAHEVAHIVRGDYAAGVVARFGLALHFYHPLVHWIVARLLLQQELAADAWGARLSGGSRTYLLALSRLALRLEEPSWVSPAKMFLAARGQLIRRIQMLRRQARSNDSSLPALGRAVTIAVLGAVGLGVASLRGPAPSLADDKPGEAGNGATRRSVPKTESTLANAKAFDLSDFPGHDMGFVMIRPAEVFRIPGLKQYGDRVNAAIADELKTLHVEGVEIDVRSIEQVAVGLNVRARNRKKGQRGQIMTGAFALRSVHDRDWMPVAKAFAKATLPKYPNLTPVHFEGQVYYECVCPAMGAHSGFYFPDGRTVVYGSEDDIRAMIKQPKKRGPAVVRSGERKAAGRGLYAIVINNVDHRWKLDADSEGPDEIRFCSLIETSRRIVISLDWNELLLMKALATYDTDRAAESAARTLQDLLAKAGPALETLQKSAPVAKNRGLQEFYRVARGLLDACVVRQNGRRVEVHGQKELTAKDLATIGMELFFF